MSLGSDEHPNEPEVTPEPELFVDDMPSTESTNETLTNDVLLTDDMLDDVPNAEISNRYELPPRSTRGIPLRRYDPEFEAQRSRCLVNRENNQALSQIAVAFNTSLYSNIVPNNVEEALRDLNWKKQWKKRSLLLTKMKHGRSVTWQKKIRQLDADGYTTSNIWLMVRLSGIKPDWRLKDILKLMG